MTITATVYGTPDCKPCAAAKAYLESKGVRVVTEEPTDDMTAVPVIRLGAYRIEGFRREAIDEALRETKLERRSAK